MDGLMVLMVQAMRDDTKVNLTFQWQTVAGLWDDSGATRLASNLQVQER